MFILSKSLSASTLQSYHQKDFAAKDQASWSEHGEITSEWQGRLAQKFGLNGAVAAEDFVRLSQGQHPETGEQLVQRRAPYEYTNAEGKTVKTVGYCGGWDAVISAPKSVSLTALVGEDDRVREAHRASVQVALERLEPYAVTRVSSRFEAAAKLVVAKFEHDSARPVDGYASPHLHTHAVIFNLTEVEKSGFHAIVARGLFESQRFATAVYQSELTYRLRDFGYDIATGRSGAPEIKGYTQEYLDASSPRRRQALEYVERKGYTGRHAFQIALFSTRESKQARSGDEMKASDLRSAAEHGNQADAVVRAARQRVQEIPLNRILERVGEAVTLARDKHFERATVVDERSIVRDALRHGMGDFTPSQVYANLAMRLASGEFRAVDRPHASFRQLTTTRAVAVEQEVLARVVDGKNQVDPVATRRRAIELADEHPNLNRVQKSVVEDILSSRDRVQGLQGFSGITRDTVLATLRPVIEAHGFEVHGLARTQNEARQLRDIGIEARPLEAFLSRSTPLNGLSPDKHFYVADESILRSTLQMREFLSQLGAGDRLLLIGDVRSGQKMDLGRPFEQFEKAGMPIAKLDEIVRQKDPMLEHAVSMLANLQVAAAFDLMRLQDRVREIPDREERIRTMGRIYAESPRNSLIVSPDHESRREVNLAVRRELKLKGTVASEDHGLRIFLERPEMTKADRKWASQYEIGDVIHYRCGSKSGGVEGGSYARVSGINPLENLITAQTESGDFTTYDPRQRPGVSVYREVVHEFSAGDRILFTALDKQLAVGNRDLAVIESITPDGRVAVRLDDNRRFEFSACEHPHFDHGYAIASHSSQGLKAERVLIDADTSLNSASIAPSFGYGSLSRASYEATIFTDNVSRLEQRLGTDMRRNPALEMEDQRLIPGASLGQSQILGGSAGFNQAY